MNTCVVQALKCLHSTILPATQPCRFFSHSIIFQTMRWTCSNKEDFKGDLALPSSARERDNQQEHSPWLEGEVVAVGVFYSDRISAILIAFSIFLFLNYSNKWKNRQVRKRMEKGLKYQAQLWEGNEVHWHKKLEVIITNIITAKVFVTDQD